MNERINIHPRAALRAWLEDEARARGQPLANTCEQLLYDLMRDSMEPAAMLGRHTIYKLLEESRGRHHE